LPNILITGGARSGKSRFAQELALKSAEPVLFVATAEAGDDEMRRRIEQHQKQRPSDWRTLEVTTQVGSHISEQIGSAQLVVVDCITLLVSNILGHHHKKVTPRLDVSLLEPRVMAEIGGLIECMNQTGASFIIVTNEVGLGLVPDNQLGRVYRDLLGKANQMLAQAVDEVYLMVAGLPLPIKPPA
jgi:adenosylcobinamide kinase/adenosylcobinamide-phosphate guanylyltransferase